MNNVLSSPMNVPVSKPLDIMSVVDQGSGPTADDDKSLLATLSLIRDGLNASPLSDNQHAAMVQALESAITAAIKLERTVLNQTRHIQDMARVACTDHLTGAYNRRGFEQEFHRALAMATRFDEGGVLVYIDLDGFKPINDTYGHAAGDMVLTEVTHVLQKSIRPQDLVARIGGDEFAVLLTRTDWQNGLARAEHLKHLINTLYVRWNGKNIAVRASFGFQRFGPDADAETVLSCADAAMYTAKRLRGTPHTAEG